MLVALRLSKEWHCRPDEVLSAPTAIVIAAIEYETFLADYEAEAFELNRTEK